MTPRPTPRTAPRPAPRSPEAATAVMDFADNRLLAELFGEHGAHLARIEQRLGISVTSRGNRVMLAGDADSCTHARQVLRRLYERLERGGGVEAGDVDGALRLASDPRPIGTGARTLRPRSPGQEEYIKALQSHGLTFALGPAGTGKTCLAVAVAAAMQADGLVERIVLSRPAVEAGERLGFLPGDMRDKIDPFLMPLYDALHRVLPAGDVARGMEQGRIDVAPLAFMRGRTLSDSFVILDEAQNCTPVQMKMFLTRLGDGSRMAVVGDPSQSDLAPGAPSGLDQAVGLLHAMHGVAVVRLTPADVVRHSMVSRILHAYDESRTAGENGSS